MHKGRIGSFKYAFEGIAVALKDEPNFLIQIIIGIVGFLLGVFFHITSGEWLLGVIVWGIVTSLELANTAIEEVIDSFVVSSHPGAKKAKDVSAASVMIMFFVEVAVGIVIFLPLFSKFFQGT